MARPITYCTVEGCYRRCQGHGLCLLHYSRYRRRGSTEDRPRTGKPKILGPCTECGDVSVARNLCQAHYARWFRKNGTGHICSAEGCQKPRYANGYCVAHYERAKHTGRLDLKTTDERFWEKVARGGPDECWAFTGALRHGYGTFQNDMAHRYSYRLVHGPIPPGWHVDHKCVNPVCVNPAHLEAVAPRENTKRAWMRILSSAPHCPTCTCGESGRQHEAGG